MHDNGQHIDDGLLLLYLTHEADEQQVKAVEDWLRASRENKMALDKLEKLWTETGKITPPPVAVDTDLAWGKVLSKIQPEESKTVVLKPEPQKARRQGLKMFFRVAAIFLIALGGYGVFKWMDKEVEPVVVAGKEEPVSNVLPDNSKIELNQGAKITYPKQFKGKTREVTLEGEAFFQVAKNRKRPFIVHTDIADITVLGTSFNVKAMPNSNKVEVLVQTGKVKLADKSGGRDNAASIILEAGTSGIINRNTGTIQKLDSLDLNKLFWKTNTFVFQNYRLADVFKLLEEHFNVSIQTTNKTLENCLFTSIFENNDIDYILEVIASTFELNLKKENNTYLLDGNGCE